MVSNAAESTGTPSSRPLTSKKAAAGVPAMAKENPTITPDIRRNIASIAQLERQFQQRRSTVERLTGAVCRFAGSLRFVAAHALLFAVWIGANLLLPDRHRFDPSFTFLQVWAALEALFLSAFVLMSQNRESRLVEHWTHVTLQMSLLAEQEMTKMLQLQQKLCNFLGLQGEAADPRLAQMVQPTDLGALMAAVGKARKAEDVLQAAMTEVAQVEERA
jgi:uncharacterized membrane protein